MEKRIIEVNGVKLEVDLSQCKVIENFKVGDSVKVLIKDYSDYKSHAGVIIGFDNFVNRPAIIIAYLDMNYSSANIKIVTFCSESKDIEICIANPKEKLFHKERVLELLQKEITTAEEKLDDLKRKKDFFISEFGKYFSMDKAETF